MPHYAGPPTAARTGDVAGTLRLLAYLALSVVLIVLDHRGGWLHQTRRQAGLLVDPLLVVAGWPGRVAERFHQDAGTLTQLGAENRRLRTELLVNHARMARMTTVTADNARLRELLDAAQRGSLDVQLAPILDVDLDPTRQRLILDAGSRNGVSVGQSVIDAGGLLGQVIDVTALHATVLLLTDPDHAVPVAIARNGVRLVAYGEGRSDLLALGSIPLSSDVKVGDLVVTSGLGGRFPPGFPVGTVTALRPDQSRAFLLGDLKPAAQLDRGRDVLLLRSAPPRVAADAAVAAAEGASHATTAVARPGTTAAASAARAPGPATVGAMDATGKSAAGNPRAGIIAPNIIAPNIIAPGTRPAVPVNPAFNRTTPAAVPTSTVPATDSRPTVRAGSAPVATPPAPPAGTTPTRPERR